MDSSTTSSDAVAVVKAIVDVGAQFREIAGWMRQRPDVLKVHQECWMRPLDRIGSYTVRLEEGEGFSIEWLANADFADDARSLSFQYEVSFHRGEWRVEAGVRAVEEQNSEFLVDLPTLAMQTAELVEQLAAYRRVLADNRDEAMRLFLAGRGGPA